MFVVVSVGAWFTDVMLTLNTPVDVEYDEPS